MLPSIRFWHRIGLLVALAALALVAVTIVTLVLGRRSEQQLVGIETRYVPLIELDRDLNRIAADVMKALEDAAGAAEESDLEVAERLRSAFVERLAAGRDSIVDNGADPDALGAAFERYFASARALSAALIRGTPIPQLGTDIDTMRAARREFLAILARATSPDRTRLSAAFGTARASQRESLLIDIIVAASVLALMGLLSWRLIRRTVSSLHAVSEGVERLARGDFGQRIEVPEGDEIGDLAREANRTAVRLREYREEADREARATEAANKELEAFSYSVSHDLRAPLRAIDGFSQALADDERARISPQGQEYLARIRAATRRMGELIDDLLRLSRVSRADLRKETVELSAMAASVVADLRKAHPDREIAVVIEPDVTAFADVRLMRIVLENLVGNAWKFTSKTADARIELGTRNDDGTPVYFVRDNGAGFDMAFVERLFGPFQRLHREKDFPGTGIGLATVQRIIQRHGGRIWVDAAVGAGATFQFSLPSQ